LLQKGFRALGCCENSICTKNPSASRFDFSIGNSQSSSNNVYYGFLVMTTILSSVALAVLPTTAAAVQSTEGQVILTTKGVFFPTLPFPTLISVSTKVSEMPSGDMIPD
jgi:hypothetical protein